MSFLHAYPPKACGHKFSRNPFSRSLWIPAQKTAGMTGHELCTFHINFVEHPVNQIPKTYHLKKNYPNPFNPSTTIEFELPETSDVELAIYDILGRKVDILVNKEFTAGYHRLVWDGTNERGEQASSGVYVYAIRVKSKGKIVFQSNKKMLLIK